MSSHVNMFLDSINTPDSSDTRSEMVAPAPDSGTSAPPASDEGALALVNPSLTEPPRSSPAKAGLHPDQHWDGRRETLGSWFAEFETVLSTVSPELYEFAVEFVLSDRSKTVLFVPGQAAQLDGALPRPIYD